MVREGESGFGQTRAPHGVKRAVLRVHTSCLSAPAPPMWGHGRYAPMQTVLLMRTFCVAVFPHDPRVKDGAVTGARGLRVAGET